MYRNLAKTSFITTLKYIAPALYFCRKAARRCLWDEKLPILTYHKITDIKEGIDAFWNVSPSLFSEQMSYLAQSEYRVISLEEYCRFRSGQNDIKHPCVVLTFDDGYANFFTNAFPILEKYGFHSTLFLTGQYTGSDSLYPWDRPLMEKYPEIYPDVRTLSWSEIKNIHASGLVTFGSHSMSHPHLGLLSQMDLVYELKASKIRLEEKLGQPISYFSYPGGTTHYGDVTHQTDQMVKAAGYQLACTSEIGRNCWNENIHRLKRLGICGKDTVSVFKAKISGTLDWMRSAQDLFQRVFQNVY